MKTPSLKALLIIATVLQLVWGLVPSASKLVIDEIPVELYIALRWTISGVIFLAWLICTSNWRGLFKKQTPWVALLGIAGYGAASFGTLYGLKLGGVTNFALMGALNPLVTSIVSISLLRERPSRNFIPALCMCIVGLVFLVLGKHQMSSWKVATFSSALIIGATFLDATTFAFSKRFKPYFSSVQYLCIGQISAALFMWLLQAGSFHQVAELQLLTVAGWSAAVFVSVIACVFCYAVLYWLLNYIEGHRLAIFDAVHTISATAFGVFLFNETLNGLTLFGGGLILAGVVLGNKLPKSKRTSPITRQPVPSESLQKDPGHLEASPH